MSIPSPWWILAPLIALVSSCIISIPLSIVPPAPAQDFFDKVDVSASRKEITFHVNEEWMYWIFAANPNDYTIWVSPFFKKCPGSIKIVNGNFSRKITMSYDMNEEKITLSFGGKKLTCDFKISNEFVDYEFVIGIGSTSLFDPQETSSESFIRIRMDDLRPPIGGFR